MEMNEEQQEEESPITNNDKGNKPKKAELIEQANSAAERLERANEKTEELVRRQEELAAREVLGGRSEAGNRPVKEEEKELTPQEYANLVRKGEINPLSVESE